MRKSQDQYITEVQLVHNFKYSYESTIYNGSGPKDSIIITCPEHGNFKMPAVEHKRGKGCKQCGLKTRAKTHEHSFEEFQRIANAVHNNKYTYQVDSFTGQKCIIDITCPIHGVFRQPAVGHKSGRSCAKCSKVETDLKMRDTQQEFLEKCEDTHGTRYDYTASKYIHDGENVEITCKLHGNFWQLPSNHKSGSGCPECAEFGFIKNKPAIFYVLLDEDYTKVGITNKKVAARCARISNSAGRTFKAIFTIKSESGDYIYRLEQRVLKWLRANYKPVQEKFEGSTECFSKVDIDDLINYIAPSAEEVFWL